jgi:hypothetical protein
MHKYLETAGRTVTRLTLPVICCMVSVFIVQKPAEASPVWLDCVAPANNMGGEDVDKYIVFDEDTGDVFEYLPKSKDFLTMPLLEDINDNSIRTVRFVIDRMNGAYYSRGDAPRTCSDIPPIMATPRKKF